MVYFQSVPNMETYPFWANMALERPKMDHINKELN